MTQFRTALPSHPAKAVCESTRRPQSAKKRRVTLVDFVKREGEVLFEATDQLQLEGVMAKRRNSIYRAGKTSDWLKIKKAVGKERGEAVRRPLTGR